MPNWWTFENNRLLLIIYLVAQTLQRMQLIFIVILQSSLIFFHSILTNYFACQKINKTTFMIYFSSLFETILVMTCETAKYGTEIDLSF